MRDVKIHLIANHWVLEVDGKNTRKYLELKLVFGMNQKLPNAKPRLCRGFNPRTSLKIKGPSTPL